MAREAKRAVEKLSSKWIESGLRVAQIEVRQLPASQHK